MSRLELNLKKPMRRILEPSLRNIDNVPVSPLKMLEQGLSEKMGQLHGDLVFDSSRVLERLREKLRKPRPLVAKKRIVNNILNELLSSTLQDPKNKEALREWNSPKKTCDVTTEKEIIKEEHIDKNDIKNELYDGDDSSKCIPLKPISLHYTNKITQKEGICEKDFKCTFKHKHIETKSDRSNLRSAIDFAIAVSNENKRKLALDETVVASKKRRIACSLQRNDENSVNNDLGSKKTGLEEAVVDTEIEKGLEKDLQELKASVEDFSERNIEVVEDVIKRPDNGGLEGEYVSCKLRKNGDERLVETASVPANDDDFGETNINKEESIQKSEESVEIRKECEKVYKEIDLANEFKPNEDTVPRRKVINFRLKRKLPKESFKKVADIKTEENNSYCVEIKPNFENESIQLEESVEFKKEDRIEKVDDKERFVGKLKTCQDVGPRRKMNCSLRRRVRKPLEKDIDGEIEKKSSVKTRDIKHESIKKSEADVKKRNKTIIRKDNKLEKTRDKLRKVEEKKRKDKCRNSKETACKRLRRSNKEKDSKSKSKHIDLSLEDNNKKLILKYKTKHKKKLSFQNKDIKVKIKWKKEQLKFKITGKKDKKKKRLKEMTRKVYKQYVLKYSPELTSPKEMIIKPENDVTPMKRKHIKTEKQADNLVQTNISSFFKTMPKI